MRKNETFGRLARGALNAVANFEGKNVAIIQEELAELIAMSPYAFHRFNQGYVPSRHQVIETLAEVGVRRAYLNRTWLQRFLESARYPYPQALLDKLCPTAQPAPTETQLPTLASNLPAATYHQFVMRTTAYAEVLEGLRQRSPVVVIVSLGGMGKSSLAREVSAHCLQQPGTSHVTSPDVPTFEAVVWVSDKDHPGQLNLSLVLDEIARVLGYPGFTQHPLLQKQLSVEQLLRRWRVLLVVDNFETITDDTLRDWLLKSLPEPSKALVTTRVYHPHFQKGAWRVELPGLSESETRQLMEQRARSLKLHRLGSDQTRQRLRTVTGGNPKAIELVLGRSKQRGLPLEEVLDELQRGSEDMFADLFTSAWGYLSADARHILLAMTCFPASVLPAALLATADVPAEALTPAIEQLIELSLLEVEQHSGPVPTEDTHPIRYTIHPLLRAFLEAWLRETPDIERTLRHRWLHWAVAFVAEAGFSFTFTDLSRLARLDAEEETLAAALHWAFYNGYDAETLKLADGLEFYYYVRGLWGKKRTLHRYAVDAARRLQDRPAELMALSLYIQVLSRQGNLTDAEQAIPRLHLLAQHTPMTSQLVFAYYHTLGMYHLARREEHQAQQAWEYILAQVEPSGLAVHMVVGAQHWRAVSLHRQGEHTAARQGFEEALHVAQAHGYTRHATRSLLHLATVDLEQGELAESEQRLRACRAQTRFDDREQQAQLAWAQARLHAQWGEAETARQGFIQAIDLFERMGLTREIHMARTELEQILVAEGGAP